MIDYTLLPDLTAMAILMVILLLLRRRHPGESVDLWLIGLFFILIEDLAHTFYVSHGPFARTLHIIQLDAYVLAGFAFTCNVGSESCSRRNRFGYLALNSIPALAILTFRGLNWTTRPPYDLAILGGILCGIATGYFFHRSWHYALIHLFTWVPMAWLVHENSFRGAAYWGLFCLYTLAAIAFQKTLPTHSTGKFAIMGGFFIWALCFLVHPWIPNGSRAEDFISQVWSMQKFLISIGILIVMLEDQITTNEWLALHDQLTGLANRRLFEDRLVLALERSRRMKTRSVLLMIDLDGFKKINDAHGHLAGDEVLRGVAANLRETIRSSDTLARFGGDEFVVLATDLPAVHVDDHTTTGSVPRLVTAIQNALAKPIILNGRPIAISASLGVAVAPDDADTPTQLIQIADKRMYKLKQQIIDPNPTPAPAVPRVPTLGPKAI